MGNATADEYTKFVVDEAIARYHAEGPDAALAHYNDPESVDAQWYVFIADGDGGIIARHDPGWVGRSLHDLLGADGDWVDGEDVNPATGEVEDKHFWLVEHDGLVFGSSWHHDESGG